MKLPGAGKNSLHYFMQVFITFLQYHCMHVICSYNLHVYSQGINPPNHKMSFINITSLLFRLCPKTSCQTLNKIHNDRSQLKSKQTLFRLFGWKGVGICKPIPKIVFVVAFVVWWFRRRVTNLNKWKDRRTRFVNGPVPTPCAHIKLGGQRHYIRPSMTSRRVNKQKPATNQTP